MKLKFRGHMYPLQPGALFPASAMPFEQSRRCALLSRATEPNIQKTLIINKHYLQYLLKFT